MTTLPSPTEAELRHHAEYAISHGWLTANVDPVDLRQLLDEIERLRAQATDLSAAVVRVTQRAEKAERQRDELKRWQDDAKPLLSHWTLNALAEMQEGEK